MKKAIARKIFLITCCTLIAFFLCTIVIVQEINKKSAEKNAIIMVDMLEEQIVQNKIINFDNLVKQTDHNKTLRITVIDMNGFVLNDSKEENSTSMENHLNRSEIKQVLDGKDYGKDIRTSTTYKIKYIYIARLVVFDEVKVIIRVAIAIQTINSYLLGSILFMILILIAVVFMVGYFSQSIAINILKPMEIIKNQMINLRLNQKIDESPITKYDELNAILGEIDLMSLSLVTLLENYEKEKNKLKIIIENINQGIIALNTQNDIVLINDYATFLLDISVERQRNIEAIIRNKNFLDNVLKNIEIQEYITFDIEENSRTLEVRLFSVDSVDIKKAIVLMDVTDLRKLEIAKKEFFQNASHELNTPLTSILGYSELLMQNKDYNEDFVVVINKEASRMKNLIADMLKISELEDTAEVIYEEIDLMEIVEHVVLSNQLKAQENNIDIHLNLEHGKINADREKIIEVVNNLLDNALKYSNVNTNIYILVKQQKNKIIFRIRDEGIGIPNAYLHRVFERFFRVDRGRSRKVGGTGLGLAIVKHICNLYKAQLSISSIEGKGTEINIIFNKIK